MTDSCVPAVFRVGAESLELTRWVDPREQGVPWPDGLNFNGIVPAPDAAHVVTCQTNTGRFWRISLEGGHVDEVALEGGPLPHSDGLAIAESTVYAAVNARNQVAVIDIARDGGSARVREVLSSDSFAFPTAVAVQGDRLLVVNGPLDKMGGTPQLPFTVVALPAPRAFAPGEGTRIMKLLAILRPRDPAGVRPALARLARDELHALWRLYADGTAREMYSLGGPGAVLIIEADSEAAAARRLAELPLVAEEVMALELVELQPFAALQMLFAAPDGTSGR